jgi:hypothetical protein
MKRLWVEIGVAIYKAEGSKKVASKGLYCRHVSDEPAAAQGTAYAT